MLEVSIERWWLDMSSTYLAARTARLYMQTYVSVAKASAAVVESTASEQVSFSGSSQAGESKNEYIAFAGSERSNAHSECDIPRHHQQTRRSQTKTAHRRVAHAETSIRAGYITSVLFMGNGARPPRSRECRSLKWPFVTQHTCLGSRDEKVCGNFKAELLTTV